MKTLIELRPALEGHAGIPQEARLLFRGLGCLEGVEVQGLIQSSDRFLPPGLSDSPGSSHTLPEHERIDRLSRIVVALQPPIARRRLLSKVLGKLLQLAPSTALLLRSILGLRQKLTWFEPMHFCDFIWRSMFAKTLPPEDFEQVTKAKFRIGRAPYGAMHGCGLATRWMGRTVYPRLNTEDVDAMLVFTPYPGAITKGTSLIVRYFDAVPLLMPHTIIHTARHQALHYRALQANANNGASFVCCSDATRRDLIAIFPEVESRAVTIPCMLSHHYYAEDSTPRRVPEILGKHLNAAVHARATFRGAAGSRDLVEVDTPVEYLLMVSTIEPRKNHTTLIEAWELLRCEAHPNLKLVFVGSLGWEHRAIVDRMRLWLDRGEVLLLSGVPAEELRLLYRHALATVCPSYAEGFGYAGIEAMRCGGVVAASDIPVHREVYDDAAEYFNPYSAADAATTIARLISSSSVDLRQRLIIGGSRVSAKYLPERVLPQWHKFLSGLTP